MTLLRRFINYLKETRVELRHVNWPTRAKTLNFTFLVIGISLGVAIYLSVFDRIFTYLLDNFILQI